MIELGILVLTTPLLQYVLIKLETSEIIYGGIPFCLCFFGPFYYRYGASFSFATYCCFLLFNYLRFLDISLLPKNDVRTWTIYEYFEYFLSYYTKAQRKQMGEANFAHAVPYSKRTAEYYGKVAWSLLVQYFIFSGLIWFEQYYPPNRDLHSNRFLWPTEFKNMIDNLIFGLILCLILNIGIIISYSKF